MATFDSNFWGGGAYTPTDFSAGSAAPSWVSYSEPNYAPQFSGDFTQPNYYDQYAGYSPQWGSSSGSAYDYSPSYMPGESSGIPSIFSGGLGGIWDGIKGWAGESAGTNSDGSSSGTNGGRLASAAIQGGLGLLLGTQQSKALEKARKRNAEREDARNRNAGKVAGQQRLDYLNTLRQDPNFRAFTVNAPDRNVTANAGDNATYGQGGEHLFFDPNYLSKITTTPVPLASGGLVDHAINLMRGGMPKRGGLSGGQADDIPANLSEGEYVMDADVVSALGDGSTEAGAAKLDKMRQNIRKHKRSGGLNSIPPKAKDLKGYLK